MAVHINIKAIIRDQTGKEANRKLRRKGLTPAVLYGHREEALSLYFNTTEFLKQTHGGELHENTIFNLEIEGDPTQGGKAMAIIKELQFEPISDKMVHVDFYEMTTDKPVSIEVPVEAVGVAKGVKVGGGFLEHIMREVLIECLPSLIPDSIKVDVTNLDSGDALHIRDLQAPEGIKFLDDPERVVFTIVHAKAAVTVAAPAEEVETAKPESPESEK